MPDICQLSDSRLQAEEGAHSAYYQRETKSGCLARPEHDGPSAGCDFRQYALGNHVMFRQNLASALVTLPLRQFLLNQSKPLPDGDDGSRGMLPDLELFSEFAWQAYMAVPGLRKACTDFLGEPNVLRAEAELRQYWQGLWRRGAEARGSSQGWRELADKWISRLEEPTYQAALRLIAAGGTAPEIALVRRRRRDLN